MNVFPPIGNGAESTESTALGGFGRSAEQCFLWPQ